LGEDFARHAGYNEVGELNNIIIVYPGVIATEIINPNACWDVLGYIESYYGKYEQHQLDYSLLCAHIACYNVFTALSFQILIPFWLFHVHGHILRFRTLHNPKSQLAKQEKRKQNTISVFRISHFSYIRLHGESNKSVVFEFFHSPRTLQIRLRPNLRRIVGTTTSATIGVHA